MFIRAARLRAGESFLSVHKDLVIFHNLILNQNEPSGLRFWFGLW
jgi:hypothetical protein